MRKHVAALITPLAALAVAGTVAAGPAQANGEDHDGHDDHGWSAEVETTPEASDTLEQAGVTLTAEEPATAEPQEDGTTEVTFPAVPSADDEEADSSLDASGEGEVAFEGGLTFDSEAGTATWSTPTVDTSEWTVGFEVDGEQVDVLQAVPVADGADGEDVEEGDTYGDDEGGSIDLTLTTEGADSLNQVAGDETFAEGDVLAQADVAHDDC
jgi:hypothetical protein